MNDRQLLELIASQVGNLTSDMAEVKSEVAGVKSEILKTNMTIEHHVKPKIDALFDGYKQNSESLVRVEEKIDNLQIDVNNLTIKTAHNDSRIIELSKKERKASTEWRTKPLINKQKQNPQKHLSLGGILYTRRDPNPRHLV